jgi:hypothetical protein
MSLVKLFKYFTSSNKIYLKKIIINPLHILTPKKSVLLWQGVFQNFRFRFKNPIHFGNLETTIVHIS